MGFGLDNAIKNKSKLGKIDKETLHKLGCKICPLSACKNSLKNPDMKPTGTSRPLIYILGTAPNKIDDRRGEHFSGHDGDLLRAQIPDAWLRDIRWNYCVRTCPPDGRDPTDVEIEACRLSVQEDIQKTKPVAIFGFGNIPLQWATGESGIYNWRGRRMPVRVGIHTCWFYPMFSPQDILDKRRWEPNYYNPYGCDEEFAFTFDLKKAFKEVDRGLSKPIIHTPEYAIQEVEIVTGHRSSDLKRIIDHLRLAIDDAYNGLDYETKLFRPFRESSKLLTAAVSITDKTLAFPIDHSKSGFSQSQRQQLKDSFKKFLMVSKGIKCVHHLPFEMEWSAWYFGREVLRASKWGCSVGQAYLLDERYHHCLSLNFLCKLYFGLDLKAISGNLDKNNLDKEPLEEVLLYNGYDAKYHRRVFIKQEKMIKRAGLEDVYEHHLRRIPTVVLTQIKGIPVRSDVVAELYQKYTDEIKAVEAKIAETKVAKIFRERKQATLRPSSPIDVKYAISKILNIPIGSVDEASLSKINNPFAKLIVDWRKPSKMRSTYVEPLQENALTMYDGLLHPILNLSKTHTWRTSSEDVNSQNFPKRGPGKIIRKQIGPIKKGYKVVTFDYGQIQARNVAMESCDNALVKSFWDRHDIHRDWAHIIADAFPKWVVEGIDNLERKDVLKIYRDKAKNKFVFPSFFGAGYKSIAESLKIPHSVSEDLHVEFWNSFPDIKDWHKTLKEDFYRTGYVTGCSGFRRYSPVAYNEMINSPIQGDEAIIVLDSMIRLSETEVWDLQPNMEIHDDLSFIWPVEKIDELAEITIKTMLTKSFDWINVPLVVEMSVGDDWYGIEEVGIFESYKNGYVELVKDKDGELVVKR